MGSNASATRVSATTAETLAAARDDGLDSAPTSAAVAAGAAVRGPVAGEAFGIVGAIRGQIASLIKLPLERMSSAETLALLREVEAAARAAYGAQVRLAMETDERGLATELDIRSAAHLLHQTLNITIGQARARLEAGRIGLGQETITGETLEAAMPALIAEIDAGAVSAAHATVITRCLARIPAGVDSDTVESCRETLLDQAHVRDANGLQKVVDQILSILATDGEITDPPEGQEELHIGPRRGDGLTPVRGMLAPLAAEQLRVAVEALATPKPVDDHTPDPRPAPLRRAQAFAEILHRHLTAGAGPRDGGVRPQVVVTIPLTDLLAHDAVRGGLAAAGLGPGSLSTPGTGGVRGSGGAWSDYDGPQTAALARMLACDAEIIPQVLGGDSVVLDQGRAERRFTAAQRRAVTTRDKGCAFPGCDTSPAWTDVHHIKWWKRDGGPTDLDNAVLLCRRHHTLIHQGHWQIKPAGHTRPDVLSDPSRRGNPAEHADHGKPSRCGDPDGPADLGGPENPTDLDDTAGATDPAGAAGCASRGKSAGRPPDRGRPRFIPPAYIDPQQKPRQNTHFHLPGILTTQQRR